MADGASIEKERRRKRERTVTKECRANRVDEQHPPKKMKMNSTNRVERTPPIKERHVKDDESTQHKRL